MGTDKVADRLRSSIESWASPDQAKAAIAGWRSSLQGLLPIADDEIVRSVWENQTTHLSRLEQRIKSGDLLDDSDRQDLEQYRELHGVIDMDGNAGDFLRWTGKKSPWHAFGAFAWLSDSDEKVSTLLNQRRGTTLHTNRGAKKNYDSGLAAARMFSMWGIDAFQAGTAINRVKEQVDERAAEIERLKEVLKQKEIVGAPESYWGTRATHSLIGLGITGVLLVALVLTTLWVAAEQVDDFRAIENQNTFVLIKSSVTMVILFWLLLLIGRIFLGQLQLYSDAKERVVMVQTFLSLVHDRSVDALNDRDLVLRSLFKSGATGVFRDQGDTSAVVNLLNQVSGKSGN